MKYGINSIACCLLFLVIFANGHGHHTKFNIWTEMTTITKTVLTTTVCVILAVNPMPVCRRRRQLWMEEPIFWTPEVQFFIQPTHIFQVEPTELPMPWFRDDDDQLSFPYDANVNFNTAQHDIQPSLLASLSDYQRKIPFKSPANINGGAKIQLNQIGKSGTTKKSRVTVTFTKPTTEIEMTTKTFKLGVSGCTISPFPYDVCI